MAKPRGNFKGRKREGSRPRTRPAARVVDPGLFYALRATVREVLALCEEPHKLEDLTHVQTRAKLRVWLEESDAWHREVPVREREPARRELPGQVAPREGNSGSRGEAVGHVYHSPRKKGDLPSWPSATQELPAVEALKDGTEPET